MRVIGRVRHLCWAVLAACLVSLGCHHFGASEIVPPDVPHENHKVSLGDYIINPPDVLVIDLVRAVPLPPYKIKPQDLLFIQVTNTPPDDPIKGVYRVEPEGMVRLGPVYGSVSVTDLSVEEAQKSIETYLKKTANLKEPQVSVSLEQTAGIQLIRGEHLVRPDGSINLGLYGRVPVAGMNQETAKAAIEEHLSQFFLKPAVSIDIGGFNSSVYYVIFDGGGFGEQVTRFPFTGSETVLDAIGLVSGLPAVASKSRVWLARPDDGSDHDEVLPIDWCAITQRGRSATNYQIFPGDRIYVAAQPIITFDTFLSRALAPVERVLGVTLLGSEAVHSFVPVRATNTGNGSNVP